MPLDMKFWKNLALRIFFKPHVGKQFLRASNIFMKIENKLGHFISPLSHFVLVHSSLNTKNVICALCFVLCHVICWGEIFHAPCSTCGRARAAARCPQLLAREGELREAEEEVVVEEEEEEEGVQVQVQEVQVQDDILDL